jgi:hypothetical protein
MIFIYCFNLCHFHLRNSYFKLSFVYFCNLFSSYPFTPFLLNSPFKTFNFASTYLMQDYTFVTPNLNHFEKEENQAVP